MLLAVSTQQGKAQYFRCAVSILHFRWEGPEVGALSHCGMGGIKKPEIIEMDDAALAAMATAGVEDLLQINHSEMAF